MEKLKINGIYYEVTKSETPEDKEREGYNNTAKMMRDKKIKRQCFMKRLKGERIYWIYEYERGFLGKPIRLGGPEAPITTIYQRNANKLEKLGIIRFLEEKHDYAKLKSGSFMDLNLDHLYEEKDFVDFAMAHNYIQNGDVMSDPDMRIRYYPGLKAVEALSYQDYFGYQQVYENLEGKKGGVRPKTKNSLNRFLGQWLTNLINQKFHFQPEALFLNGEQ